MLNTQLINSSLLKSLHSCKQLDQLGFLDNFKIFIKFNSLAFYFVYIEVNFSHDSTTYRKVPASSANNLASNSAAKAIRSSALPATRNAPAGVPYPAA